MTKPPGVTPWSPPQGKGTSRDDAPVDGRLPVVPGFSELPSPEMGAADGRRRNAQETSAHHRATRFPPARQCALLGHSSTST